MVSIIESLTTQNYLELCQLLEARDLVTLSHASHRLREIFSNDGLWESHLTGLFQTQATVVKTLREGGLPDFNPTNEVIDENARLLGVASLLPLNSKTLVLDMIRSEVIFCGGSSGSCTRVQLTFEKARELLANFQRNPSLDSLYRAAYLALCTIPFQPVMALHLLAFIPFAINHLGSSLKLANLGLKFDEGFEPLLDLKSQVEQYIDELDGEGKTPLVVKNDLSAQFKAVVGSIFNRFTKPGAKGMGLEELAAFITVTNHGQAPPREFVDHVFKEHAQPLGPRFRPVISRESFELFYLYLAISDPLETRADLASHGFDPNTLLPLSNSDSLLNAAQRLENLKL